MRQAFDIIAQSYDVSFTSTHIGTAQRNIVWNHLEKTFPRNKKLNILELNCGTGQDALWFSRNGHRVLATDISEEMLAITQKKISDAELDSQVRTYKLDINNIDNLDVDEKFDLVFSNFGGMNCISPEEMMKLPSKMTKDLGENGRIIMVVMPSFCLWETIYFLTKLKLSEAFRRLSKSGTMANLKGAELQIHYYSPGRLKKMFNSSFNTIAVKPIGFLLPPSYLDFFFNKHQTLFKFLNKLENLIRNRKSLSGFSDHYLIEFQLKKNNRGF